MEKNVQIEGKTGIKIWNKEAVDRMSRLPDSTTAGIVIQHSFAVLPQHVARAVWYFVDDAF